MTDRINDVLTESMRQIVDMAPEAPALPRVEPSGRRARPFVAVVAGFAVALVTVGVVAMVKTPHTPDVGTGTSSLSPKEAAFAELGFAADATNQCIEDLGLATDPPEYHDDAATFAFTWAAGTDEQEAAAQACIDQLFEPVNSTWMDQYGPTPTPARLSLSELAALLDATPLSQAEIQEMTGSSLITTDAYLISRSQTPETGTELGLVMYSDPTTTYDSAAAICYWDYARANDNLVIDSAQCGPAPIANDELATFGITASWACDPSQSDTTETDRARSLVSVWGVPPGLSTVTIVFADGSSDTMSVTESGVAQKLWNASPSFDSIRFDGITPAQSDYATRYFLGTTGTDCTTENSNR